jgi:DNA-binding transcriptional regulator GbsR (MarR family)
MTDLARKRAIRAGHRGVITKLTKEADYILSNEMQTEGEEIQTDKIKVRLQTLEAMLREKLKVVKELDEQILGLCEETDISKEIEEADEIVARVLDHRQSKEFPVHSFDCL